MSSLRAKKRQRVVGGGAGGGAGAVPSSSDSDSDSSSSSSSSSSDSSTGILEAIRQAQPARKKQVQVQVQQPGSDDSSDSDADSSDSSDSDANDTRAVPARATATAAAAAAAAAADSDSDSSSSDSSSSDSDDSSSSDSDDAPATATTKATTKRRKRSRSDSNSSQPTAAAAAKSAAAQANSDALTVFVNGLPYDTLEADVRAFFQSCGPIASLRLPKFQDSGRLLGYGHVEFSSKKAFDAALELDGEYLGSRYLSIAPAKQRDQRKGGGAEMKQRPSGCTSLFVKNLPYDTSEEAVSAAFSEFGPVTSVRLARWHHTQKLKGVGYVQFKSGSSAAKAMHQASSDGVKVGGRFVWLDYETRAPRRSFKTAQGQSWHKVNAKQRQGR